MILWEGDDIVAIATGFDRPSHNTKTGPMVQVWILHRHVAPLDYRATGADVLVCGNCPQRHHLDGGCYVVLLHGPQAVWNTYRQGGYPALDLAQFRDVSVRFGAYGDPAFVPLPVWDAIRAVVLRGIRARDRQRRWTAYTHQWRCLGPEWAAWCMASVDTVEEQHAAAAAGWSTFRARAPGAPILPGEVVCPAAAEAPTAGRVTCATCLLCAGRREALPGFAERRPDWTPTVHATLVVHGNRRNFHVGTQMRLFDGPVPTGDLRDAQAAPA